MSEIAWTALLDWRRALARLYRQARDPRLPPAARLARFRAGKDRLFRHHPASPLTVDARRRFAGLAYAPYDPGARVVPRLVEPGDREPLQLDLAADGRLEAVPVAGLRFRYRGQEATLTAYALRAYGGGLFVPFADATTGADAAGAAAGNGFASYGGGRYLLDTVKHADLGSQGEAPILDFNYAYAPSCAYDPRWVCPLAPPANRLPFAVVAGEVDFVTSVS